MTITASDSSASSSNSVALPSSLAFLVSNFHTLVPTKLDSTNYMLWRIQIENAMRANGYYEYLEGSIGCPPAQLKDSNGNLTPNPAFLSWKLIDTQLLSCLTASLSQSTLPYVLGLHHAYELWESLSNRYNSLTKNHVQELKCKLYNIKKTSTMEAYVDLIKEYAQKLAAAGSPLDDDDLIFHTLRGLPPVFNGFKSAVRTRGSTITFDELITMMYGEDLQMSQDSANEPDITSVLIATHGNTQNHGNVASQKMVTPAENQSSVQKFGVPMFSQYDEANQSVNTQQVFLPQQQYAQVSRNNNRGRNFRGGRYPRDPCAICGRNNHTTNYCYYKGQGQQFEQSSGQGRNSSYQAQSPLMCTVPQISAMSSAIPQYIYSPFGFQNGFLATPGIMNGFNVSQSPGVMNGMSMSPMNVSSGPILQNVQSGSVPRYASSTVGNTMAVSQGMNPSQTQYTIPQAHFTGAYNVQYMIPSNSVGNVVSQRTATPENSGGVPQQPWYFDSGATHHITNNLQNLNIAQPAANGEGIMVGNGNNVPITHTGQEFSSTPVQGPLSQGTLSHSELL